MNAKMLQRLEPGYEQHEQRSLPMPLADPNKPFFFERLHVDLTRSLRDSFIGMRKSVLMASIHWVNNLDKSEPLDLAKRKILNEGHGYKVMVAWKALAERIREGEIHQRRKPDGSQEQIGNVRIEISQRKDLQLREDQSWFAEGSFRGVQRYDIL